MTNAAYGNRPQVGCRSNYDRMLLHWDMEGEIYCRLVLRSETHDTESSGGSSRQALAFELRPVLNSS